MKSYRLMRETLLDAPIDVVFDFFSRAENLEKLTPASLRFHILTPLPIEMRVGALIDYKLRIRGFPVRWTTEITVWEPKARFVDSQLRGPYHRWIHKHSFVAEGNRTRMLDDLEYVLPFGPLGQIAHALFVEREVQAIFRFREEAIQRWLQGR